MSSDKVLPTSPQTATQTAVSVNDNITVAADPEQDHLLNSETDSTYSESAFSTFSLGESIFNYRTLHGRTFNSADRMSEYWAPNDSQQNEGVELMYYSICLMMNDKLFYAPIKADEACHMNVLDIGTGTGIWAIDFVDVYPGAQVIGTDISPIQPSWVPPNVYFQIHDFLLDWTWPENHFNFIHGRLLYGAVPDYTALYKKAYKHLVPGGWCEELEIDPGIYSDYTLIPPTHIFSECASLMYKAGERTGKSFTVGKSHEMRDSMIEAGFIDVVETRFKLPIGDWPKEENYKQAGLLCLGALERCLEGYVLWGYVMQLGMPLEQVLAMIAQYKTELRRKANRGYILGTIVYGRKPMSS